MLGYEEALTRQDSLTGDWYDCSAHMLWIGERTRQLDGAHVEFLRGVGNPIGCKIGPTATPDEVRRAVRARSTRTARPGRLTLITRMGADARRGRAAARCSRAVARRRPPGGVGLRPDARQHVHAPSRPQDPPLRRHRCAEIGGFFAAHRAEGTWPGGVHVELTGDDVTECLGGADEILDRHLDDALRDDVRPAAQRPPVARPRVPGRRAAALKLSIPDHLGQELIAGRRGSYGGPHFSAPPRPRAPAPQERS